MSLYIEEAKKYLEELSEKLSAEEFYEQYKTLDKNSNSVYLKDLTRDSYNIFLRDEISTYLLKNRRDVSYIDSFAKISVMESRILHERIKYDFAFNEYMNIKKKRSREDVRSRFIEFINRNIIKPSNISRFRQTSTNDFDMKENCIEIS